MNWAVAGAVGIAGPVSPHEAGTMSRPLTDPADA
jgi:hypothetical protein